MIHEPGWEQPSAAVQQEQSSAIFERAAPRPALALSLEFYRKFMNPQQSCNMPSLFLRQRHALLTGRARRTVSGGSGLSLFFFHHLRSTMPRLVRNCMGWVGIRAIVWPGFDRLRSRPVRSCRWFRRCSAFPELALLDIGSVAFARAAI